MHAQLDLVGFHALKCKARRRVLAVNKDLGPFLRKRREGAGQGVSDARISHTEHRLLTHLKERHKHVDLLNCPSRVDDGVRLNPAGP